MITDEKLGQIMEEFDSLGPGEPPSWDSIEILIDAAERFIELKEIFDEKNN